MDDYLNVWDKNGDNLPGFPVGGLDAINVQVMVGGFDGLMAIAGAYLVKGIWKNF